MKLNKSINDNHMKTSSETRVAWACIALLFSTTKLYGIYVQCINLNKTVTPGLYLNKLESPCPKNVPCKI